MDLSPCIRAWPKVVRNADEARIVRDRGTGAVSCAESRWVGRSDRLA